MTTPTTTSSNTLKAALFDIDGTLADTDIHHRTVFAELFAPLGIEVTHEFFDRAISGKHNTVIAQTLLPHLSMEDGLKFMDHKEHLFRQKAEKDVVPLPGLMELLKALNERGVRCMAVTNAPRPNAELLLRVLGVMPYLEDVVMGDDCSHPKPHPAPYLEAIRRINAKTVEQGGSEVITPEQCAVFEDSPTGCAAGRAAGCTTIGIRSSQTHETLIQSGADVTIADYTDLEVEKLIQEFKGFLKPEALTHLEERGCAHYRPEAEKKEGEAVMANGTN